MDGVPVPLGPPQQRALLALLLLHANEVVSRDRIVDELWGERPPATAAKLVQVYVSRLRKVRSATARRCSSRGRRATCCASSPTRSDLRRVRAAGGRGQARRWPRARRDGGARASGGAGAVARTAAGRPRFERRSPQARDRAARGAAAGRAGAIGSRPTWRWAATTWSASSRRWSPSTRCASACGASSCSRSTARAGRPRRSSLPGRAPALVDELGIEPGRELRELEQAILRQDPALDLAPVAAERAAGRGRVRRPRARARGAARRARRALAGTRPPRAVGGEPGIGKSRLAEELGAAPGSAERGCASGAAGRPAARPPTGPGCRPCARYVASASPRRCGRSSAPGRRLATILPELAAPARPAESPAAESERRALPAVRRGRGLPARRRATRPLAILPRRPARGRRALAAAAALPGGAAHRRAAPASSAATATPRSDPSWPRRSPTSPATATRSASRCAGSAASDTSRLLAADHGRRAGRRSRRRGPGRDAGQPAVRQGDRPPARRRGRAARARLPIPAGSDRGDRPAPAAPVGRRAARCSSWRRWSAASSTRTCIEPGERAGRGRAVRGPGRGRRRRAGGRRCRRRRAACASRTSSSATPSTRSFPPRGGCACTARSPRRSRRCTPAIRNPTCASSPTTTARRAPAAAEKAIAYAQRAGRPGRGAVRLRGGGPVLRSALDMLETARSGDADRTCELLLSLGEVLSRAGSGEEAREALRQAADLASKPAGPTSSRARRSSTAAGSGGRAPASTLLRPAA